MISIIHKGCFQKDEEALLRFKSHVVMLIKETEFQMIALLEHMI